MQHVLISVLPLAIGSAISPTVLAAMILVLSDKRNGLKRGLAFGVGTLLPILALATFLFIVIKPGEGGIGIAISPSVSSFMDMTLGVLLLILAVKNMFFWHPKPKKHSDDGAKSHSGLAGAFALGLVMMASNITSLVLFIPGVREIMVAVLTHGQQIALICMMVFFVMLPVTVPLLLYLLMPIQAMAVLGKLNDWTKQHFRVIVTVVCLGFGAYLIFKATTVY